MPKSKKKKAQGKKKEPVELPIKKAELPIKKAELPVKKEPLRDSNELLRAAMNQIIKHPETWDQKHWHKNITHCFGGWLQLLAGRDANPERAEREIMLAANLTASEVVWLSDPSRKLPELYLFVTRKLTGGEPIFELGRNAAGYDRDGFDIFGFDADGWSREGYDRFARNRFGRDKTGHSLALV